MKNPALLAVKIMLKVYLIVQQTLSRLFDLRVTDTGSK